MYNALCNLQLYLKIYDSEIKYIKYRQNIEGNDSFRIWKCSFRSLTHYILSMLVFCRYILSFIAPYHKEEETVLIVYADECLYLKYIWFWDKVY